MRRAASMDGARDPETTRPGRWARAGVGREEWEDDARSDLSKGLRAEDPARRSCDAHRRWRQDGDGDGDGDGAVDPEAAGEEDGAGDPDAEPPPMAAAALAASVASDVSMSKSASE